MGRRGAVGDRDGVNDDDDDRCDRQAFYAAACLHDWDRYDNHCRGRCGYYDLAGRRGGLQGVRQVASYSCTVAVF